MKKILMISYYFPPLRDVGSLRALGYSRYLPEFGWEPYVLSVKNPDKSYCSLGNIKPPEKVTTYYCYTLFNLNWISYKVNGVLRLISGLFGKKIERNIVQDLFCIPDIFSGWIVPAFIRGAQISRKHDIDIIYVSIRPFSAAISGVLIKKILKKKLVLDFRDPISFPEFKFGNDFPGKFNRRMMGKIERYVLTHADKVLVTTDETKDEYVRLYPFLEGKIQRIYNGYYMKNSSNEEAAPFEKFTISYTGNYYYDLYPSDTFFRALHKIVGEQLIPKDRFRFLYLGELRKNSWLDTLSSKYGLEEIISTPGEVSRKESVRAISRSALMLLRIVPPMISTKLFEGLVEGVPILAVIDKGEVERLINKYSRNSYVISTNDADDVADAIVDAYGKWERGELKKGTNGEYLRLFNKRHLTGEFAGVLDEIYTKQD